MESSVICLSFFMFWVSRENLQMALPTHNGAENSVRLLLTKNLVYNFRIYINKRFFKSVIKTDKLLGGIYFLEL